jgi:glucose-6-phosphate 1-epimerase
MSIDTLAELNRRFSLPGQLTFGEGPGGLPVAKISNAHADAMVSLSGGHVMTWAPKGEKPVLWLSKAARLAPGKSIRGGIPVCWPWFGPHVSETGYPAHGFARTAMWTVESAEGLPDGTTRLALTLVQSDVTRAQWPHAGSLTLAITVGKDLTVGLSTRNLDAVPVTVGEALHTYFAVSDVRRCRITGLDGCAYWDKASGGVRGTQQGDLVIASEVDRVYLGTDAECVIEDPGFGRRIRIAKAGSRSTVVWNPWTAKAEKMGDFGPDGYLGMVCVESGNALDETVIVPAAGAHTLAVRYCVEALA